MIQPPAIVGAVLDTTVLGATGALLLALFGYLFKELRRKDEGVWAIVADRDKRILEITTERNYWRALAMGEEPPPLDVVAAPHPAPVVADDTDPVVAAVSSLRRRKRRT